jgi:CPA2 family monovalent cation:H+ antiporter-2
LGHSRDQADRMVDVFSDMDRKTMIMAAEHYDPAIPIHENEAFMAMFRDFRTDWEADLTSQMAAIMAEPKS